MILADTHAWIWWMGDPDRLSNRARMAFEESDKIGICAISCWEVAMLVAKKRIGLDRDVLAWIKQSLARPRFELIAISPGIAVEAAQLSSRFLGDPADRLIVAAAMLSKADLVTKDRRIRVFQEIRTIW